MANEPNQRCAELQIAGMTCGSCELMLERKLKKVPGVLDVDVDHRTGTAKIVADESSLPDGDQIETVIREAGYSLAGAENDNAAGLDDEHGLWKVAIDGMTCRDCEKLLRQKFKLVHGVKRASVHADRGTANIYFTPGERPLWEDLQAAVESAGYQLRRLDEQPSVIEPPHKKWMEIGACLLIIFALYQLFQAFDLVSLAPSIAGASTFGGILLIGLVAGTSSCLAVTGGLLLSVAAKYNETHHSETKWQKFKPLLSFNIGRIASYFLLGGIVGLIGTSITLTPRMTGYMSVVVALVMVYLALSILKIIPKGSFPIRPPKAFSHWIANLSESKHPAAPFALGALTFFLPCGFTQSLQLAALASGSFVTGALTMGIFSLGTLPALIGISAISSAAQGSFSRLFLRFSGVLVFALALFNLNSGLLLTGVDAAGIIANIGGSTPVYAGNDPNVTQTSDGQQIINMNIRGYGYEPRTVTIEAGKPTWIYAQADSDIGGCTGILTAPTYNLTHILQPGQLNKIGPIQNPDRDFILTCSMGMVSTRVKVVGTANPGAAPAAPSAAIPSDAQVVDISWTANGYSPQVIEVQKGQPTVVRVSSTSRPGGCMSTIVFPQFNQSAFVPQPGEDPALITLDTVRAQPGDYTIACGMGSRMAVLRVKS